MHEVSLMQSALETAIALAEREGARKILRLKLRIGELSGVVPEALRFAFDVVTRETLAEGAELEVEEVPAVCYCRTCDREFSPGETGYVCSTCGTISRELRRGRELALDSMEVV